MGSGCQTGGSSIGSALFQKLTPDTQVKYTGVPYPQFGICTGDLLSEVEISILGQIDNFSKGINITLSDIDLTQCDCFKAKVGCCGASSCQTLVCILQAYLDCMCEIYTDVQKVKTDLATLTTKVNTINDGPYVTSCLPGVTGASKFPAIAQAMITQICANTAAISAASSGLGTIIGNFLSSAIQGCNTNRKSGSGSTFAVNIAGFPPIGSIVPMAASGLANFTGGLGNAGTDACGWAIADGTHGTVNMIGLFPVGTTNMTGGAAPVGGGPSMPVGIPGGAYNVTLSSSQVPAVSFSGSTPPTTVTATLNANEEECAFRGGSSHSMAFPPYGKAWASTSVTVNIPALSVSGSTTGGGGAHTNVPPYMPLYFIQRMF